MGDTALYMLAILPPEPLKSVLEEVRQEFATRFNCKAALRPPVHITLIPPFKGNAESISKAATTLKGRLMFLYPFTITFQGFGSFPRNKVIYVNVKEDKPLLYLQALLEEHMAYYFRTEIKRYPAYHPHYTIGRKDIPKGRYSEAEHFYRHNSFNATFDCNEVGLLRYNGVHWEILEFIPLGNNG